ncbi:MAG: 4'-phosphopantetheinyl transferase superfamily protein [Chloroflexi bacterium]|nr:4'-phosphopantetheinyl transferase superfamily protein [Chloroflexota bacterium]
MIYWLTQTQAEMPETERYLAEYLGEAEREKLASLRMEKRRQDWLLGRWTAKRLLQRVIWEASKTTIPLDLIAIDNDGDGVPTYQSPISNLPCSISISHGHGRAFVAAVVKPDWPLGADMERVAPRPDGFVADYFTEAEAELVERANGAGRDRLVTAVWSAKEAVLKALHLGLSVDTRAVSCLLEVGEGGTAVWRPFAIHLDERRLPRPVPDLAGWWRTDGDFVLTLAAKNYEEI